MISFAASSDGRVIALVEGAVLPEELALYDRSGKKLDTLAS